MLEWGLGIVLWVQGWGSWLNAPMQFFSFLGTEQFFLLVLPLLYWCFDTQAGTRIGVALLTANGLNSALKMALHMPRPFWVSDAVQVLAVETSFGAPSGHAQISATVWPMAASILRSKAAAWGAALVVLLIGLSRLYLGVHFPHDVLLGWAIGLLTWQILLHAWQPVAERLGRRSSGEQILMAFFSSLLLVGLAAIFWLPQKGWHMPAEWAARLAQLTEKPAEPVSLQASLTAGGTLFGFFLGMVLARPLQFMPQHGSWLQKTARYAIGLIVLVGIWAGLGNIFPGGDGWLPWLLRYIRYALLGSWVSGGAPWIFRKLNLE